MATGLSTRVVNVINLGRMGFLNAYDIQVRYARQHLDHLAGRSQTAGRNTLLLVEHNPVYTVGIRYDYGLEEEKRLKKLGAEFYRTNRGGLITFHGPGQLVVYPILDLHQFHSKPRMKRYITTLELTIMNTCRRVGVDTHTSKHPGIWVEDRNIASIGALRPVDYKEPSQDDPRCPLKKIENFIECVHGSRYVTTHGISLNCNTDLNWFKHIIPDGTARKKVTSLSQELQKPTSVKQVLGPFLAAFEEEFECEMDLDMLDREDMDALKSGGKSSANQAGPASASQPPLRAMQRGMKPMSMSALASAPGQSKPRVSMW